MYRLPLLHLGMPLGCPHYGVGLACPKDSEVYALRGPLGSTTANGQEWTGTQRRGKPSVSHEYCRSRLRKGLSCRCPTIRGTRRNASRSAWPHFQASREIHRPHLWRKRGWRNERFVL